MEKAVLPGQSLPLQKPLSAVVRRQVVGTVPLCRGKTLGRQAGNDKVAFVIGVILLPVPTVTTKNWRAALPRGGGLPVRHLPRALQPDAEGRAGVRPMPAGDTRAMSRAGRTRPPNLLTAGCYFFTGGGTGSGCPFGHRIHMRPLWRMRPAIAPASLPKPQ
ncbi:MAG: hypothetical protein K0S16_1413 [Moraxellaceae bacterium]|nr:hypothetical protein [Moraxellaceae bacterium]